MDYKKAYEQAIERAKGIYYETIVPTPTAKGTCEYIFPELSESEDEEIRYYLINFVKINDGINLPPDDAKKALAWLEKQGEKIDTIENFDTEFEKQVSHLIASAINKEHEYNEGFVKWTANALLNYAKQELEKPVDKVEPKFKVGDWIISSDGTLRHIIAVGRTGYETDKGWLTHDYYEKSFHLWTIQDAKDGDVLVASDGSIFIFKEVVDYGCKHYIALGKNNETINVNDNLKHFWETARSVVPATKEQRDLLFTKMKEAGYEWNGEKKELKKIEQKSKEKTKFYDSMDDLIADALIEEIENSDLNDSSKHNRIFWIKSHRQKPAWSEEDEDIFNDIIMCLDGNFKSDKNMINWLKSLKERYTKGNKI